MSHKTMACADLPMGFQPQTSILVQKYQAITECIFISFWKYREQHKSLDFFLSRPQEAREKPSLTWYCKNIAVLSGSSGLTPAMATVNEMN